MVDWYRGNTSGRASNVKTLDEKEQVESQRLKTKARGHSLELCLRLLQQEEQWLAGLVAALTVWSFVSPCVLCVLSRSVVHCKLVTVSRSVWGWTQSSFMILYRMNQLKMNKCRTDKVSSSYIVKSTKQRHIKVEI